MKLFHSSSGEVLEYDEKNIDLIFQSIHALKGEIKQRNSLFTGLEISIPLHNLANLVRVKGYDDESLIRGFIFREFISNSNISENNIDEFLESLGQQIKIFNLKETQEYHVLFPINISEGVFSNNSEIKINKINLKINSWESVKNKYQLDSMMKIINEFTGSAYQLDYLKSLSTPLIGIVFDKNSYSAFRRVEEKAEIFRSVLNFFEDDEVTIQLGYPRPLAKVRKTGHYGVFSKDGILIEPFVEPSIILLNENKIFKKTSVAIIQEFIGNIDSHKSTKSISEALTAALKLYSSALDTIDYSNAYLSLWQCIEALTMFSNEQYSMAEVVERIQSLLNVKDPVYTHFLRLSAKRRNNLVHKGIFNIEGQSEVQLLRTVAKYCIINFLKKFTLYKTYKEFEHFYKLARLDKKEIKIIKNVADTLIKTPTE